MFILQVVKIQELSSKRLLKHLKTTIFNKKQLNKALKSITNNNSKIKIKKRLIKFSIKNTQLNNILVFRITIRFKKLG